MQQKLLTRVELIERVARHRSAGDVIVFTNGCFDLVHAGHVRYLTAAKAQGDVLVLGLNSDASVRRIKDAGRPIVPEAQRAEVLAGLACVDCITLFDAPDPLALIEAVAPDVLVKGGDWQEHAIIGADRVAARGGRVVRIPLVPDISTTRIIRTIVDRYAPTPNGRT